MPDPGAEERATTVAVALDRAVNRFVTDLDPEAFETRPPWPGAGPAWGVGREPLPLPAIQAAQVILAKARDLERATIAHARGRGESWTNIGKALGELFVRQAKQADMRLALAAWRYAVYRVRPGEDIPWTWSRGEEVARWRCWDCCQHVAEAHPDNGPDAEAGHTGDCPRLAARRRRGYR